MAEMDVRGVLERLGTAVTKPTRLEGRRVRAIDGSHISEQGSTGSNWILHYSWEVFGLRNDYFEITPNSCGESALHFPIKKGDIILADWHYGKAKALVGGGGDFVMRLKHKAANYFDENGQKIDLLTLLRPLATGEILDVTLHYRSEKKVGAPLKPLRICAVHKSKEQAERAKRKTLRQIKKNPHKKPADQTTLADYFVSCTATTNTQGKAMSDACEAAAESSGERAHHIEGHRDGTWLLMDFSSVVVHVFTDEARKFYDLERLWSDAEEMDMSKALM